MSERSDEIGAIDRVVGLCQRYSGLVGMLGIYYISIGVFLDVLSLPATVGWVLMAIGSYPVGNIAAAVDTSSEPDPSAILAAGVVIGIVIGIGIIALEPSVAIQQNCGGALCL